MYFLDRVIITVKSGNGGNGSNSFLKNKNKKYIPNGGSGGNGGNIYIKLDNNIDNLYNFKFNNIFISSNGNNGGKNNCTGKSGNNLYINVPSETLIIDYITKDLICIINDKNNKVLVARGGFRGLGNNNKRFKYLKNKNINIKNIINGKLGEKRKILLKFNLKSDVGILGLVNSGKSLFFKNITKIKNIIVSNYEYTTKNPKLGIVNINKYFNFTIMDTPGLIYKKNLSFIKNKNFLNHFLKCKILLHIVKDSLIYNENFFIYYINNINILLKKNNINIDNKYLLFIFNKFDKLNKIRFLNKKIINTFYKYKIKNKYFIIDFNKSNFNANKLIYNIYKKLHIN